MPNPPTVQLRVFSGQVGFVQNFLNIYLVTYSEVAELACGDRFVAQPFSDRKIPFPTDQGALALVLVQSVPQPVQLLQTSSDPEPLHNYCWITPRILVVLTPCTAVHDSSKRHVKFFVIPKQISKYSTKLNISSFCKLKCS